MLQTEKTKKFIQNVKSLVDSGEIKNYAIIVDALGWDKTIFSNVINGRRNVPNDVYKKFTEIYQPVEVSNPDVLSLENLIKIDSKCDVILSAIAEILATQRGQTVSKINSDLVSMVNQSIKGRLDKL